MRRPRSGALAERGSVTLSTPFLNEASTLSDSTANGRAMTRSVESDPALLEQALDDEPRHTGAHLCDPKRCHAAGQCPDIRDRLSLDRDDADLGQWYGHWCAGLLLRTTGREHDGKHRWNGTTRQHPDTWTSSQGKRFKRDPVREANVSAENAD